MYSAVVFAHLSAAVSADLVGRLLLACLLAFVVAWLSSVGGVGGSVLMLLAFTMLFGMRIALPVLALAQLVSNGGRVWFNRRAVRWRLLIWYAAGAVPFAVAGGLVMPLLPVEPLKRLLGMFLIAVIVWRRVQTSPGVPRDGAFVVIGAGTGLGSSLFGAAGSLAAPFFLAKGLAGAAYIGTEAAASLIIHVSKVAAYGAGDLLSQHVIVLGLGLTPAIVAGAWLGKKTLARMSAGIFGMVVEAGTLASAVLLIAGV
ncbi:sulfite exporter TauE/SafE family protein [Nonomuraea typhae]|uniref:sulfite exporter TauE/SafE family protein n=1 Tax=Nonomuraea typhae TaxID=2603600 RepID=UPI0012F77CB4|nr:sulfite exporter TauE/SafE family protein [Nonomuraea typhae]